MEAAVERRDPEKTYNKVPFDSLSVIAPGISWDRLFTDLGVTHRGPVIVAQPAFLKQASSMVESAPIADWQVYLRWHTLRSAADC